MFYNLSAEIKRHGLSQKEFAKKVKISESLFSKKMHSKAIFNYKEIKRIFEYFNSKLSLDYLFEESIKR